MFTPLTLSVGNTPRHRSGRRFRGLTLLDTALAILIVGIGAVAGMRLVGACTQQGQVSLRMTNAVILADNIHEFTTRLPFWDPEQGNQKFGPSAQELKDGPLSFNDIADFRDEVAFNPPINSAGVPEPALARYTVYVQAIPVNDNNLLETLDVPPTPPDPKSGYEYQSVRFTVRVEYLRSDGVREGVHSVQWIRSND